MTGGKRPDPVDLVVAVALLLAAQVEIWAPHLAPGVGDVDGSRPVLTLTAVLMTAPLAFRRVCPLGSGAVVLGAACAQQAFTVPTDGLSSLAAMMLAAYSIGAYTTRRQTALGAALLVVTALIVGQSDFVFVGLLLMAAWFVGLLISRQTHHVAHLESDRELLIAERQVAAERGAVQERRRIARELHDVVAHRVSMMVIQAQSADALLATSPADARNSVRAIEEAGREALGELRSLLGLLRTDVEESSDPLKLAPAPGLDEIDVLVAQALDAGLPITFAVQGEVRPVGDLIGAAAFRVIQEAITNVVKHGDRAATSVLVTYGPDHLDVSVTDTGPARGPAVPGFGLSGMRERVDFVGGTLNVGPLGTGGFSVHARLPYPGLPS